MGTEQEDTGGETPLAALYHRALPQVYGYLLPRCGSAVLAEDLAAETFMAAVAAAKRDCPPELTVAWLVGVARHKLVDHWRRADLERRSLGEIVSGVEPSQDRSSPPVCSAASGASRPRCADAAQRSAIS